MPSTRKLVIVESPAKARTISGYLGPDFEVEASVGHIRDLPQPSQLPEEMKKGPYGKFAIDVEGDFTPYYVIDAEKKQKITELKRALKASDELYLATDEDREGEAIAWHLLEVLQPTVPVKRMVFHEITQEAITRALDNTRSIDERLVDAQEARRVLDRLVGYEVSPLLWRKVKPRISAGRVQSVATRMVVERERERMGFRSATYFDVRGTFAGTEADGEERSFTARLANLDGDRIATGRDFTDAGRLKDSAARSGVIHLEQTRAEELATVLQQAPARVASVTTKPYTRRPAAPFTTSTLQQEASRKLRMSARDTMRTAQSLYENGFITYMRTDSTALSSQAINAARSQATELYGPDFVPNRPRVYSRRAKGAQEAHEAIRPAGDTFRTPAQVSGELSGAQFRLYELIWKRTVASQMSDARGSTATVRLAAEAQLAAGTSQAELVSSGTVITFRGFLAAYEESRDAERYGDDGQDGQDRLPTLSEGQAVRTDEVEAEGHETTPAPRYTEASLVKAMEEHGIGRPSTYAATISVITERGYVNRRGQALVPTWLAFSVVRLLEENLPRLVDYDFTAAMETDLDDIATGETERVEWLARFYRGDDDRQGLREEVNDLGDIDARAVNSIDIGEGITLRVGRYGPYVETETEEQRQRASVPDDVAPDELTVAKARELLAASAEDGRELGIDPATGHQVVVKTGRFGPYVTEVLPDAEDTASAGGKKARKPKARTASLLTSMSVEGITLDDALQLLSLPRVLGTDPETNEEVTAHNGRYGPYLKRGSDSRTLPEGEDQLFTVTLEEAQALFAQPKRGRGASAKPPLRELGTDPASDKPVVLKDGRYGPYVTDGKTNASLRQGDEVESLTPERAYELLADRRAKAGTKKQPVRRTTKRSSTKQSSTKQGSAKQSGSEKSSGNSGKTTKP